MVIGPNASLPRVIEQYVVGDYKLTISKTTSFRIGVPVQGLMWEVYESCKSCMCPIKALRIQFKCETINTLQCRQSSDKNMDMSGSLIV